MSKVDSTPVSEPDDRPRYFSGRNTQKGPDALARGCGWLFFALIAFMIAMPILGITIDWLKR